MILHEIIDAIGDYLVRAETTSRRATLLCGVAVIFAVAFDLLTPQGLSPGLFYAVAVLLSLWHTNPRFTKRLAIACTLLLGLGFLTSPTGNTTWIAIGNRLLAIGLIWFIALFVIHWKHLVASRERWFRDREEMHQQIKTLQRLLPICVSCKKIRDKDGLWTQLEVYMDAHSEARVAHDLCPECLEKLGDYTS